MTEEQLCEPHRTGMRQIFDGQEDARLACFNDSEFERSCPVALRTASDSVGKAEDIDKQDPISGSPRPTSDISGRAEDSSEQYKGLRRDAASRDIQEEGAGCVASSGSASSMRRTPTGDSPLPDADRLAGLLSEAEALLRETAITAAMAAAAANETTPILEVSFGADSGAAYLHTG